jgi:hypothetical protein
MAHCKPKKKKEEKKTLKTFVLCDAPYLNK